MLQSAGLSDVLRGDQLGQLEEIFNRAPVLRKSLEVGAWICGGFPRALLLGRRVDDYLDPTGFGDIDVFFPTIEAASLITRGDLFDGAERSLGGFAMQKYFMPTRMQVDSTVAKNQSSGLNCMFKIQAVNKPSMIKSTLLETLDTFDFVNCQVAIAGDRIYFPNGWREVEDSRLIRIRHASSPFLGSRIIKYLNHRGMVGITDDSCDLLTEWLCKAGSDGFEGYSHIHFYGIENSVRELRRKGLVNRENLIFFLNKWKDALRVDGESYGEYVQVDWALEEISRPPVAGIETNPI